MANSSKPTADVSILHPPSSILGLFQKWGSFVRFSHTVFALPFALAAMCVAARDNRGWPGWRVFGFDPRRDGVPRTCAMAFNRIVDRKFDAKNPRTANRHLPAGAISLPSAPTLCVLSAAGLIAASYFQPALLLAFTRGAGGDLFYSLTKRFTDYTHVFLGIVWHSRRWGVAGWR